MKKRLWAWLLAAAFLLSCLAVFPLPARAQESGEWVLVEVEDYIPKDVNILPEDEGPGRHWEKSVCHYARSNFSFDWFEQYENFDGVVNTAEGKVSAEFGAVPERIRPDETVTISVSLSSSGYDERDFYNIGEMVHVANVASEPIGGHEYYKRNMSPIPDQPFVLSETLSFSLPTPPEWVIEKAQEGILEPYEKTIYFELLTHRGHFAYTIYTYRWVLPDEAPVPTKTPESARAIDLKGVALSVENKPMKWMPLSAHVYYGARTYTGGQADAVFDIITDHKGRFKFSIPAGADEAEPVGILLTGAFKCVYPFDNRDVFYFIDMQDTTSVDMDMIAISSWILIDPQDYPAAAPDTPIITYRLLTFNNMGVDGWSFSLDPETFGPDQVIYYNTADPDHPERLRNYSALYTAAFDAWFFGAAVLDEKDVMLTKPVRTEVRWPATTAPHSSHYDSADHCVRLEESHSLRDDSSRFTILHEFGHAFDYITNGGQGRAVWGYGPDDVNHGGYMNETTADSYLEGFATFYAGTVQLFSGYTNPHRLGWVDLSPAAYTAWGNNGVNEEFAIASLLYNTHSLVGGAAIQDYWGVLREDRKDFYEYYSAIEAYVSASSSQAARQFRQLALDGGLYQMPFGSGAYEPGEPFRDLPGGTQNQYDPDEPYADMMFDVDSQGFIDPSSPLRSYDKDDLVAGRSSDAARVRRTIQPPESGYLYLTGEEVKYLLVDILPTGQKGSRMLRAVEDGRVLIGLPDVPLKGKVMVSVPGGTPVYEGDLAELQRRQMVNAGKTVPLHEVLIPREALPDPAVVAVATYGDVNATGVLPPSKMSYEELVRLSEGYNNDTGLDEIVAALGIWKDDSGDPGDTGGSGSAWHFLLYMAVALGVLAIAALILFICLKKTPALIPVSRPGTVMAAYAGWPNAMQKHSCLICGAAMPEQAKFCASCGTAAAASCEKSVCTGCGGMLVPNAKYCDICGKPAAVQGEAPAFVCPDCGTRSFKNMEFCTKCGRDLSGRQP